MTESKKDVKMPPLESPPFEGRVDEIRVRRIESETIPGGQVAVIYFNSIGERDKPEVTEWSGQTDAKKKMDEYEHKLLSLIGDKFQTYPVVIAAVPPHAGTLFAFGNPLGNQSEVNPYKLATLDVSDMSVKDESTEMPHLIGCPLDIKVLAAETEHWLDTDTLDDYANAPRNPSKIQANMKNPNKISGIFKVE